MSDTELIYGLHAVDALLRHHPDQVQVLFVQAGRRDKRLSAVAELARNQGVEVVELGRYELDAKADGKHQGVVAQAEKTENAERAWDEPALLRLLDGLDRPALLLVLDSITDPHNLGACLRSANAAGVDAVIAPKDGSADISPTVRKVACGAAETVPFVRVTNLARTLGHLKKRGLWIYGTVGEAEQSLYDCDLREAVAIVAGAEGKGLRRLVREACDMLVKLPMTGSVGSLNVSVAVGVCLFEAVRQRNT